MAPLTPKPHKRHGSSVSLKFLCARSHLPTQSTGIRSPAGPYCNGKRGAKWPSGRYRTRRLVRGSDGGGTCGACSARLYAFTTSAKPIPQPTPSPSPRILVFPPTINAPQLISNPALHIQYTHTTCASQRDRYNGLPVPLLPRQVSRRSWGGKGVREGGEVWVKQ
jgi:hypothetical protein